MNEADTLDLLIYFFAGALAMLVFVVAVYSHPWRKF